jgi:RNA polymerase sigma-70 factor (ECF subfamily)
MFAKFGPLALAKASQDAAGLAKPDLYSRVTALYETHRDGLYRFLVAQGLSPDTAQDAAQEVFIKLFAALSAGKKIECEQGWLYGVAARTAVDHWRRTRPAMWVPLEFEHQLEGGPAAEGASPETASIRMQQVRRVAAAMTRLRKEQRMCILLRAQGLRYREIAQDLGVSVTTVSDWLAYAIEQLREAAGD